MQSTGLHLLEILVSEPSSQKLLAASTSCKTMLSSRVLGSDAPGIVDGLNMHKKMHVVTIGLTNPNLRSDREKYPPELIVHHQQH